MKLAIIEDSAAMLRVWAKLLDGSTHTWEFFESTDESLRKLREANPEAVLCPGCPSHQSVSGLTDALGQLLHTRPLILATSQDQAQLRGAWDLEVVDGILVKPFTREALLRHLDRLHERQLAGARARPLAVVVDDSRVVTAVLSRVLGHLGFDVQTAADGLAGLRLIEASLPDIAVVDVEMPGLTGWEVCEALSKEPRTRDIPVVVNSATVDEEVERRGFMAGSLDVLAKPVNPAVLAETVKRRLRKGGRRRQATALVLEDEVIAATLTRRMLADLGVASHVCTTISELRAYLALGRPTLLLLDQALSDGSGTDLCLELRAMETYDRVPIVLTSSSGQRRDRLAALRAGADDFLRKPFTRHEFRVRLERLVEEARSVDAA